MHSLVSKMNNLVRKNGIKSAKISFKSHTYRAVSFSPYATTYLQTITLGSSVLAIIRTKLTMLCNNSEK